MIRLPCFLTHRTVSILGNDPSIDIPKVGIGYDTLAIVLFTWKSAVGAGDGFGEGARLGEG